MAKIILGKRPETFVGLVSFPLLEGGEGTMQVTFKYRTRTEFGKYIDNLRATTSTASQEPVPAAQTIEQIMQDGVQNDAENLLEIMQGWSLDQDFNLQNLKVLSDEIPAAAKAIVAAYGDAIHTGRVGNSARL